MKEELQIRASSAPYRGKIELWVSEGNNFGTHIIMTRHEENACFPNPTVELSPTSAQLLMDDLWTAGIRPTEGAGSAGAMAAAKAHLEDMRTLTFKLFERITS